MTSPAFRSAASIRDAILAGKTSAVAVLDETLARFDRLEPKLSAFLSLDRGAARRQAQAVDARVAAGDRSGALLGVPVAQRVPATAGSLFAQRVVGNAMHHVLPRILDAIDRGEIAAVQLPGGLPGLAQRLAAKGYVLADDNLWVLPPR